MCLFVRNKIYDQGSSTVIDRSEISKIVIREEIGRKGKIVLPELKRLVWSSNGRIKVFITSPLTIFGGRKTSASESDLLGVGLSHTDALINCSISPNRFEPVPGSVMASWAR